MTGFDLFINNYLLKRHFVGLVLVVILLNLIIGGILLPYQQQQRAQAIWSSLAVQIPQWVTQILSYVWSGIQWAYNNAKAAISAAVDLWNKSNTILKEAIRIAWKYLKKKLLDMLVNDIVKWIQNGTTPRFVSDWKSFATNAADAAGGDFVTQYLGMGFLCDTFDSKLKIALSKPQTFNESAIKCTLSKITSNINNFFNNFSNGGWAGWIEVSETQNNIMGATLMVLDQKYDVMAKAAEAAKNEATSATGYLGDKVCSQVQCADQTTGQVYKTNYTGSSLGWTQDQISPYCTCLKWEIRTPGRVAADSLQQAAGVDINILLGSDDYADYAAAIIDAVINRIAKEGVAAMKTGSSSSGSTGPGIDTAPSPDINISTYTDASTGQSDATTLLEQLAQFKKNLGDVATEYQTNLNTLNLVKSAQNNTLDSLKDIVEHNCTVPSGVIISQIPNTQSTSTDCVIISGFRQCPCNDSLTEQVKFTVPGTGEGIFLKTTAWQYKISAEFNACELNQTIITYEKKSSAVVIQNEIDAVNAKIMELQDGIAKIDTASKDTSDYKNTALAYMALYEEWQNSRKETKPATVSTAETTMGTAKTKAISSNQAALSSSSTSLNNFIEEATERSGETASTRTNIMTKRGFIADCAYAQAGSYYKDICDAQAVELTYKNARNSCFGVDF